MAPKKSNATRRAMQGFTPTRANPKISEGAEEESSGDEDFDPSKLGRVEADARQKVSPPSTGKEKETAASSSKFSLPETSTKTLNWIIEQLFQQFVLSREHARLRDQDSP
jgi:hypothetical protein